MLLHIGLVVLAVGQLIVLVIVVRLWLKIREAKTYFDAMRSALSSGVVTIAKDEDQKGRPV